MVFFCKIRCDVKHNLLGERSSPPLLSLSLSTSCWALDWTYFPPSFGLWVSFKPITLVSLQNSVFGRNYLFINFQ